MRLRQLFHSPRARRGIALGAVILSLGGLVLVQAPAAAVPPAPTAREAKNAVHFHGPGAHGTLALSHGLLMAGEPRRLYAELRIRAADMDAARERAPLSLVVVLDTSGSMDGDKLREAKRSVKKLLDNMRGDDEVALVRYASEAHLVQRMAPVSEVRQQLSRHIDALYADGGTNIPGALQLALGVLRRTSDARVKRMVLVSDGLDNTRAEAVRLAQTGLAAGATISALGIGLDFDEAYLAAVSRAGHGNFAFVDRPSALARFLNQELTETATTTVRGVRARLHLPAGLRFVRAIGAQAQETELGVELTMGNLFAGDERRVVIELEGALAPATAVALGSQLSWSTVAGEQVLRQLDPLSLNSSRDADEVARSRDEQVYASCLSAVASWRQLEAAKAYRRGDRERAQQLIGDNVRQLREARRRAPAAMKASLARQADGYAATSARFGSAKPDSAEGSAAAKRVWAEESVNTQRKVY